MFLFFFNDTATTEIYTLSTRRSSDLDRARQELKPAQVSLPNDPAPFLLAGYIDRRQGHWDESTSNMERALELDPQNVRSEEHTSELQSQSNLVCRLLLEKKTAHITTP